MTTQHLSGPHNYPTGDILHRDNNSITYEEDVDNKDGDENSFCNE